MDIGGTESALGSGNANTNAIISKQGASVYAAKLCYDIILSGYSDWYLPSSDELETINANRELISDLGLHTYWSFTQVIYETTLACSFSDSSGYS